VNPLIVSPNLLIGRSDNIKVPKENLGFITTIKGLYIPPEFSSIHGIIGSIDKGCIKIMPLLNCMHITVYELVGHMQNSDLKNDRVPAQQDPTNGGMQTIVGSVPMGAYKVDYSLNIWFFYLCSIRPNIDNSFLIQKVPVAFCLRGSFRPRKFQKTKRIDEQDILKRKDVGLYRNIY